MRFGVVAAALAVVSAFVVTASETVLRVGFGSCNRHQRPQTYWSVIGDTLERDGAVDGFVWLGDVVYADRSPFPGVWLPEKLEVMRQKLVDMRSSPEYGAFVSKCRPLHANASKNVFGVWDDHDMGKNDGGKEFAYRTQMKQYFLDFLDVPADATLRRHREGLYALHGIPADEGVDIGHAYGVCVLLLDGRYHRDAIGTDGDMLGDDQWSWLEQILADPHTEFSATSPRTSNWPTTPKRLSDWCAVTVVGSGVQFLGDEKPTEHWGHFKRSRDRFLRLLRRHHLERFLIISGDVHYAEIQEEKVNSFGFPLIDVTSSGLTHNVGNILPNWLFDAACETPRRVGRFLGKNYGVISLFRHNGKLSVRIGVHDVVSGSEVLSVAKDLDQLRITTHDDAAFVDIPVHSGLLKTVLWTVHQKTFPNMPVHKLLTGFIALTILVFVAGVGVCVRMAWRRLRRKKPMDKKLH